MLFSGLLMENDKLLKVGTYKYTRGEDSSPYFDSFYEDTYDTGDGDYSYMSFHAYDGELKIVESTEEVIRGEFTLKGLYDLTDNKRSEEHTSELQSRGQLVCRLLLV